MLLLDDSDAIFLPLWLIFSVKVDENRDPLVALETVSFFKIFGVFETPEVEEVAESEVEPVDLVDSELSFAIIVGLEFAVDVLLVPSVLVVLLLIFAISDLLLVTDLVPMVPGRFETFP